MKDIVVFGSGGHAKVVIDIIEKQGLYQIKGIFDKNGKNKNDFFGLPILGTDEDIKLINAQIHGGIVAIGDNYKRAQVSTKIKKKCPALTFISAIHPSAVIAKGVIIGEGSVIMAGGIINSDTSIGKHCIVNTQASIDHENKIGDFVAIGPNATTGGNVTVGDYSSIMLGAKIIPQISIGEHTIIGAGSIVIKNIPSNVIAYGSPAKVIRSHETRLE